MAWTIERTGAMALAAATLLGAVLATGAGATAAPQAEQGERLQVAAERSHILAVTGKGGLLSFLGHRHAILAPRWTASIRYDPEHRDRTRVDVTIDTASLQVDTASARALAGLSGDGPGADDIETVHDKMLGARYLDAEAYPQITFRTVAARYAYETLVLGGPLSIRGHSRDTNVSLQIREEDGGYRVTGTFRLRLSDYGIEPETVGGVVTVADEVEIRLDVLAMPPGQEDSSPTR